MSSASTTKPDPCAQVADNDMNTWANVSPGHLEKFGGGAWAVFRCEKFRPYESQRKNGGTIVFESISGKAEIWLDEKLVATKTDSRPARLTAPLPAADGPHALSVLVETAPGQPAGLGGPVRVQP